VNLVPTLVFSFKAGNRRQFSFEQRAPEENASMNHVNEVPSDRQVHLRVGLSHAEFTPDIGLLPFSDETVGACLQILGRSDVAASPI
jgi:hypothetical protein